jgi:hypothetical protein
MKIYKTTVLPSVLHRSEMWPITFWKLLVEYSRTIYRGEYVHLRGMKLQEAEEICIMSSIIYSLCQILG